MLKAVTSDTQSLIHSISVCVVFIILNCWLEHFRWQPVFLKSSFKRIRESDNGKIWGRANLNSGGLDLLEIFLQLPHLLEGGADRELRHCSEPVQRATNCAGSVSENTIGPAVVRVLAFKIMLLKIYVSIWYVIGWHVTRQLPQYIGHHLTSR